MVCCCCCSPVFSDFAAGNLYYWCYAIITISFIMERERRAYSWEKKKKGLTFSCLSMYMESWGTYSQSYTPLQLTQSVQGGTGGLLVAPVHLNLGPPFVHRGRTPALYSWWTPQGHPLFMATPFHYHSLTFPSSKLLDICSPFVPRLHPGSHPSYWHF